jgi:SNF2 family DNA or RNA helicase
MKYKFRTKPYQHQVKALKMLLRNKFGGALLMEPRTGKTKVVIDYLSILAMTEQCDRAVVIAPARVMDVWVDEFAKHCPVRYALYVWDKNARKYPPPIIHNSTDLTVLVVNYEAFGTPGRRLRSGKRSKTTGRYKNRSQLLRWLGDKPAACILDESHKVKSPSGRASTMIVGMRDYFDYRVIMTGTPITKAHRIFDIYMQWKFLNPERFEDWPTVDEFRNHFGVWTHRNGYPQFLRQRNLEVLKEKIHADAFEVSRDECFDLPPRLPDREISIVLDSATQSFYTTLAEQLIAEFEARDRTHFVEASIPLVLALRLGQVTGGYSKSTEGEIVKVGNEKLRVLEGLLDEAIENEERIIIAARFRPELDAIQALCNKKRLPNYALRGGITRAEGTENVRKFQASKGAAAIVMNPQAGGVGIDLSAASHMIWYSLPTSWVNYKQSEDRMALCKTPTSYTYLLARHTIDETLRDTLRKDGDVAKAIVKNPRKAVRGR